MNMRRSRSSPTSSGVAASRFPTLISCCSTRSRPSSSCLRSSRSFRRRRSIARCFAVAMSQAPGLSGTPDSGHCSSAATRASCARSSARPISRTIRARPAISLGDSILQTASIARCVSAAVTATDHTIFNPPPQDRSASRLPLRGLPLQFFAQLLLARCVLGRKDLGREVRSLEDLANLDLALLIFTVGGGAALGPFDRLCLRLHLNQPEARDQFLRLGQRPIDYGPLP